VTNPAVRSQSADSSRHEAVCTEGSVAEVGPHPTDEKRTSFSQVQSSWASVGGEVAVVSQEHFQTAIGGPIVLNSTKHQTVTRSNYRRLTKYAIKLETKYR